MILKLKLEYKCYPVWIYENGKVIDNDLPRYTDEYEVVDELLCELQRIYDNSFVDDGVQFDFIGLSEEQKLKIMTIVDRTIDILSKQFTVENTINFDWITI